MSATDRATTLITYTYDLANRLSQVNDQLYSYDLNGNLLHDGVYTYTYDTADRAKASIGLQLVDGLSTIEYRYNGDGVRTAEIVDGLRADFVQDIAAPLPQVLTARQGGSTAHYLRGLGLIGEQGSGNDWRYYLPDALGSIRQLTDPAGQVALSQQYDPFGSLRSSQGESRSAYGPPRNYGFAGEEQDPLNGQLFLRARTYQPSSGRFLQADPLLGSPTQPRSQHRYAYAFNNPVN